MAIDPTDYAVLSQAFVAAAREMGGKLIRAGYSTILREAKDGSTGIIDRKGRVVAQSELIPMHLGSMGAVLEPCLQLYPIETLEEGDFLINNDPYHGGQHLQDIFIFTPVFFEGEIVGFTASVAHHVDIGGAELGLNMAAKEVYQEGVRIPPTRYNLKRDWHGGSFQRLLAANFRAPDQTLGDLNAQFAANAIGSLRLQQLCAKYGAAVVMEAMDELMNYSERRIRAAIKDVPDGVYVGEDWLDDSYPGGAPLLIRAKLTVTGDALSVDFEGTAEQVEGNINCPISSTISSAVCCVKAVLTSPDIPLNDGVTRVFEIKAPYGSILNPHPPAAVRARTMSANRAWSAVMKALAQVAPDAVIAGGADTTTAFCLTHRSGDKVSIFIEPLGGGFGATSRQDGCDAIDAAMSNCANTPIEAIDAGFDFFRIRSYKLEPDSFGAGRFRGGAGFSRRFEILKEGVGFGIYSDHYVLSAQGLDGGQPGQPGFCRVIRGDEVFNLPSKGSFTLLPGDFLEVGFPGGAGYGPPEERSRALIEQDIEDGLQTV
ncbi:hydantoinase B/oxoprolinase family protein [Chelatococcus sp. YT9]|uniref:hydantoinase B/oxoprolinase family protein n=1 Tax=Chelatococcus sp. YT9 TaxID=2835635 RepID=UPI001BCC4B28|nr:hydantoinase B/oxoprolinase family protein [Chelatococcus sp. YT9]MBS7701253.1 hydantoinase B/oxoprolinase family protein [Chelatococcus sp. YT9]